MTLKTQKSTHYKDKYYIARGNASAVSGSVRRSAGVPAGLSGYILLNLKEKYNEIGLKLVLLMPELRARLTVDQHPPKSMSRRSHY
jgi:hypothetical protein